VVKGIKKLILVTASHHPHHKMFIKLLNKLVEELKVEKEIKSEDYLFLIKHGETDEFGMAWIPQLLVELEDGSIKPILTKMPFDKSLRPDLKEAYKECLSKLKELGAIE